MAVTINIKNKLTKYIDGRTGQEISDEQFQQRHNKTGHPIRNFGGNQGKEKGTGEIKKN